MCDEHDTSNGDIIMLASDMVEQIKNLGPLAMADLSVMSAGCGGDTFHAALDTVLRTGLVTVSRGKYTYTGSA